MGDLGMHPCHMPFRAGWYPKNVRTILSNIVKERPDGKGGTATATVTVVVKARPALHVKSVSVNVEKTRSGWRYYYQGFAYVTVVDQDGNTDILLLDEPTANLDPDNTERVERLVADYRAQFTNPYIAAARGYLDAVIAPRETRPRLIAALKMVGSKRAALPMKKHSNIPL